MKKLLSDPFEAGIDRRDIFANPDAAAECKADVIEGLMSSNEPRVRRQRPTGATATDSVYVPRGRVCV